MKNLFLILILFTFFNSASGQTILNEDTTNYDDVDVPPTKALGYSCVGLGATVIGFTAFKVTPVSKPALAYGIGGALIGVGLGLLIWGDNEGTPKYWRGMKGYLPEKNITDKLFMGRISDDRIIYSRIASRLRN